MTRKEAAHVLENLRDGEADPWMRSAQKALEVAIGALHEQPQNTESADACRGNCTENGTRSDCQGKERKGKEDADEARH